MSQVVLTPFWQVFDNNGNPAAGAKARFFTAGTSTPVNVFSDSALTIPHAVPVVADSAGRFPTIYAAAGDYKIKVTNSADVDLSAEVDNWTVLNNLTQTILSLPTVTKTTNYTVVAGDRGSVLEFDPAGATLIVTLPAATLGNGFPIWIVNTGTTGTVQLQFSGAETLLGLTTYSLTDEHQAVGLTSRGAAGWRLIAAVTLERLATIASAGTITLGDGQYVVVTGTTNITDIDFVNEIAGHGAWVKFSGILQLTQSATLLLPSGVTITTAAGDTARFVSEGADVVRCIAYNRANGAPLFGGATDIQTFTASGTWTKPSGGTLALIRAWGGGGSGGKGSVNRCSGGGGGGAYIERWIALSALAATEAVTIGAGGVAQTVADAVGNAGGTTTFGAFVSAFGGGGGDNDAGGAGGGGGGGGGAFAVGGAGSNALGGTSGDGVPPVAAPGVSYGGAGGSGAAVGTTAASRGGFNTFGGGGGGGAVRDTTFASGAGGNSIHGGGGGGGGSEDVAPGPGAGGTSVNGGAGGAGAFDASNATAGTQPGGGGGGSETGNGGAGADGQVIVFVFP